MSKIDRFVEETSRHVRKLHRNRLNDVKHWNVNEDRNNVYGVMPPLETFMDVSAIRLENLIWSRFEKGDIVVGRITSKSDNGLYVTLLCFDAGKSLDIEQFEIMASCPRSEIPKLNNHENPVLRFAAGDLVRAAVIDVDKDREKLVLSFLEKHSKYDLELGIVTEEHLPTAYKRACSCEDQLYNDVLTHTSGFYNPNVVQYLKQRLVLGSFHSLIDDLRHMTFPAEEYADQLRKKQSEKISAMAVKRGVDLYGKGQIMEALQELNHALDLDSSNVEALVARGAVFANRRSFLKAIGDFDFALKLNPNNKNAKKYLVEVLVERAKSIELEAKDVQQIKEATKLYKRATDLDPDCQEAKKALGVLEKAAANKRQHSSSTDSIESESTSKTATIVKVKHLLEKEVDTKHSRHSKTSSHHQKSRRKSSSSRRDSTSSDSSSTSSTSSSSSSSSDSSPRRKRKRVSSTSSKGKSTKSAPTSVSKHYATNNHMNKIEHLRRQKSHEYNHKDNNRLNRSFSSSYENRNSSHQDTYRRKSTGFTTQSSYFKDKPTQPSSKPRVVAPITKVNKDTFGSILDQISKFEGKRKK